MTISCEQTFLQTERIRFTGSLSITSVWGKKALLRPGVASSAGRPRKTNTEVLSLSVALKEFACLCCQHPHYHDQAWTSAEDCPRLQRIGARGRNSSWATLPSCLNIGGLTPSSSLEDLVVPETVSVGLAEQQYGSERSGTWPLLQRQC